MAAQITTLPIVTIPTAGVPVPLSATPIFASSIILEADTLNTGQIYWGDSNVSAAKGNSIKPSQPYSITCDTNKFDLSHGNATKLDLSLIYIDTDTNNNKVRVTYFPWTGI